MSKILGSAKVNDKGGFIIPKNVRDKNGFKGYRGNPSKSRRSTSSRLF